jgi:hypothetical protein
MQAEQSNADLALHNFDCTIKALKFGLNTGKETPQFTQFQRSESYKIFSA